MNTEASEVGDMIFYLSMMRVKSVDLCFFFLHERAYRSEYVLCLKHNNKENHFRFFFSSVSTIYKYLKQINKHLQQQ